MGPILVMLLALFVSLVINRIATAALTHTGMSREMARFQARSAFTTVGYTTAETENVVNHPVRRKIISLLMMAGNVGLVTVLATLMASVLDMRQSSGGALLVSLGVMGAGLAGIWALSSSRWLDDALFKAVTWALENYTELESHDYVDMLHIGEGYRVSKVKFDKGDWPVGRRLDEWRAMDGGVHVLGINRAEGGFTGNPAGATRIEAGDTVLVYALRQDIALLRESKAQGPEGEAAWVEFSGQRSRELAAEKRIQEIRDETVQGKADG